MTGRLLFGTAGWSYADWKGIVYPAGKQSPHPLVRLASMFDLVEVNSSFYRIPEATQVARWVEWVDGFERFRFTFKIWKGFTHDYHREHPTRGHVRAFCAGLRPAVEAGRLAGLLIQFPHFFDARPHNRDHVARFPGHFEGIPLFLEVRHRSWLEQLDLLERIGFHFVNIDQPPSPTTLSATTISLNGQAYVRLHGRNSAAWFRRGVGRDEKYDYLYDSTELAGWAERIRQLRTENEAVCIVANNHFRGQAVVNALELQSLLGGHVPKEVPPELLATYPRLARIAGGSDHDPSP